MDAPAELVMRKSDFIDRIITDSLYKPHVIDTKAVMNKVLKVASELSALHIGR
ncbi:hypothetical protein D3C72_2500170 [compost metagenome]